MTQPPRSTAGVLARHRRLVMVLTGVLLVLASTGGFGWRHDAPAAGGWSWGGLLLGVVVIVFGLTRRRHDDRSDHDVG